MQKIIPNGQELRAWLVAAAAVFCLGTIGYRVWTAPKLPDLAPTVAHIDAATKAWSDASAQQVTSVSAIERDIRAQLWHVDRFLTAADGTLRAATGTINTANAQLAHVGPLLDSAKGAVDAVPPTLQQITQDASGVTAALPPLLVNANGAVTDVRAFINQQSLLESFQNVASMTGSWAGISGDAKKVADKATADFLKPVKWYMQPVKRSGQIMDITSAVARHTP